MKKIERLMNTRRSDCAAYGNRSKADVVRQRVGNDWWNARVAYYERLNRSMPIKVYSLKELSL